MVFVLTLSITAPSAAPHLAKVETLQKVDVTSHTFENNGDTQRVNTVTHICGRYINMHHCPN